MTENETKNFHVNTDMFGQYAKIPTGRSGDLHIYKIITRFHSNWYCDVPIIGLGDSTLHEEVTDVLNVIHCGVDESKVIRVALKDCEIIENEETKELRKYRKIGTVEECREGVEKQKPKNPKDSLKIDPVIDENGAYVDADTTVYLLCPNCGEMVGIEDNCDRFCHECGQAIDNENLEGMEDE